MKAAIIVSSKISQKDQSRVSQLLADHPEAVIYSNLDSFPLSSSKTHHPFEPDPDQKKRINYKVMNQVLEFGEKQIEGKALTDCLTFGKASLWHYHKFRIYFNTRNTIYELTKLKSIANNFEKVYFFGEGEILKRSGELPQNIVLINPSVKKQKKQFQLLKYSLFFALRVFMGFFRIPNLSAKKYLLIDHSEKQTCLDLSTLKPVTDNYNLGYLFDKLDDNFVILDEIEVIKPGEKNSGLFNSIHFFRKGNRNYINNEPIIFKAIFNRRIHKEVKQNSTNLLNFYKSLEAEVNEPVEKIITGFLKDFHKTSTFYLFKYGAYKLFFKNNPIKSVTSIDENSPRIKVILDAARSEDIKTIGIQHGTIHNLHPAFLFTEHDRVRKIMPDLTFVWGEHWKHFLSEEGNYPINSLVVTGQVRTDIIPKLIEQQKLKKETGQRKFTILFASQPQRDPELRRQAAIDVFKTARNCTDSYLIVKLHPAEKNDFGYYKQIAESVDCKNYKLVYAADLYKLISESDAVVTCFSTVGAETTFFDKPLIILDHLKQDIQNYHKKGIAFQAANQSQLEEIINKIKEKQLKPDKQAYQKYIAEFSFNADGKTADRIIEAIKNY